MTLGQGVPRSVHVSGIGEAAGDTSCVASVGVGAASDEDPLKRMFGAKKGETVSSPSGQPGEKTAFQMKHVAPLSPSLRPMRGPAPGGAGSSCASSDCNSPQVLQHDVLGNGDEGRKLPPLPEQEDLVGIFDPADTIAGHA